MILNRIPAFVLYKDLDGYVMHANRTTSVYARKPLDQIIGRHGTDIFPHADAKMIRAADEEVIRTAEPKLGLIDPVTLDDGNTQWFQIDVFPDFDETGNVSGIVVFGLDVSERKRAEEQVAYLAMHDPLTDLCNRRLLTDRLTQTLAYCRRRERRCALLFVDLDHFKVVNDAHGHEVGDLLLVQVAQRLRSCVRAEDTVARTGGDEFVILLAETSTAEDALVIAEKIRSVIALPFETRGIGLKIGSSIGVASFPDNGRTEHELMTAADTAMYASKTSGRNAVRVAAGLRVLSEHDAA
jgi:diguanylate cyclase (GGDEF)-like protein